MTGVQTCALPILPALIGPAIGPFVGASVTTYLGWRAIFLINLPLAAAAIALTWKVMPKDGPTTAKPFDLMGFVLSASGLVAAMTGLSALGEHILPWQGATALAALGAALLIAYGVRASGRNDALLDLALFRHRTFDIATIGGFIFRLSNGAISLILPLFFQLGLGTTIMVSGALSGLNAVGAVSMRALAPRLLDRFGFKPVMVLAALIRGVTILGFASVTSIWDWPLIPLLLIGGAAQAVVFTAVNAIAYAELDSAEISSGTAFSAMARQISLAMGIAFAGVVLEFSAGAAGATDGSTALPLHAFTIAYLATGLMGPLSALYFLRLRRGDADGLRRRKAKPLSSSREPPRPPLDR